MNKDVIPQAEPKIKNRFMVEFPVEYKLQPWSVDTTSKPKLNVVTNVSYINQRGLYPDQHVWSPIELTFIDPIFSGTTRDDLISFFNSYRGFGHTFSFKLITMNSDGLEISKWIIEVKHTEITTLNDDTEGFTATFYPSRCINLY